MIIVTDIYFIRKPDVQIILILMLRIPLSY
jgi:hypothetical protein